MEQHELETLVLALKGQLEGLDAEFKAWKARIALLGSLATAALAGLGLTAWYQLPGKINGYLDAYVKLKVFNDARAAAEDIIAKKELVDSLVDGGVPIHEFRAKGSDGNRYYYTTDKNGPCKRGRSSENLQPNPENPPSPARSKPLTRAACKPLAGPEKARFWRAFSSTY